MSLCSIPEAFLSKFSVSYKEPLFFKITVSKHGYNKSVYAGQAIAIAMPMTLEAMVAYFGIVLAGCAAVSIADSFAASEIASRLRIANAAAVVTQVLSCAPYDTSRGTPSRLSCLLLHHGVSQSLLCTPAITHSTHPLIQRGPQATV